MTFRREWFKTYTPFTSDHPIYLGDNSTLLAEGMGDIEIQAYVDGGWYNTYIRNVLYSPQLKKNLYSLSTSTRRGFNVIIKHDKLQIFMDNDLKAVGVRHDGLYRMLFKVTSSSQGYITSENKLQLWHERLAHLPVATLREMATKGLVDGLQPQDLEGEFFFCEGCQLGKAHRKSCYPSDGKNYQLGYCRFDPRLPQLIARVDRILQEATRPHHITESRQDNHNEGDHKEEGDMPPSPNRGYKLLQALLDLNEKYQALLVVKEGITEESIDREWQECDKYKEEKFDIQQKVSVLRNPDKEETIPIASEDTVINVKLPELALKSYDGSLEGANYVLAVQALQERFGDPNILTELYVRRLLNSVISNVKKENRNLSSLYDELSSHLRSLETLGIDPQLSGIFLYPLVESSLPSDILKIWHRHPSSGYGMELAKREESDKGVGGAQERLSQACTGQVLLMTTVALLRGPNASRRVRILLDSGSQFSYIKQSLVWSIGIERKGEITIAKSLFGGNKIGEEKHGKYMLELENLGNKRDVIHIEALDQRKICDAIPPLPKGDWLEKLKIKGIILSQDNFKGQEIDILIGANYLGMILTGKIVQVEADLTAVETKLGWTLMGNSPIIDSNDNVQQTLNLLTTRCDLKDLWDLEVLGIRDPVETCSKETRYQEIKEKFITKIQRQSDQRYSVGLPWKVEKKSIPSNLNIAIKSLDISTKKMTSQNKLTEYSQIFRDWLTEGLIERVEENPLERRGYYLPHRPVYKMESKTTPIRPVFDASCLGHNGLSLNQCLEKGPNLLERIPEMMI
ncbi:hypothetical protein LAZ67_8001505 [Cordylochernes scorpioides]|uniref:GAG-pre-integrase domain-containing protein n=1 Tax=Cordylochernes scorpioides TaxID=51811 RepID=A0ABY6KQ95_9ARAC|nr:hypothetical protein LAZ67_8001505 [Cordylochernes scorpioides]